MNPQPLHIELGKGGVLIGCTKSESRQDVVVYFAPIEEGEIGRDVSCPKNTIHDAGVVITSNNVQSLEILEKTVRVAKERLIEMQTGVLDA